MANASLDRSRPQPAGHSLHDPGADEAGPGQLYLNHGFGVMSKATIDALQSSDYLKNEFIDVETRTTVRPDNTYSGTYLNTRETYLEKSSRRAPWVKGSEPAASGLAMKSRAASRRS